MTLPGDDQKPDSAGSAHDPRARDGAGGTVADECTKRPREIGGRNGPEPTRYGDWEKDGRCIDF